MVSSILAVFVFNLETDITPCGFFCRYTRGDCTAIPGAADFDHTVQATE